MPKARTGAYSNRFSAFPGADNRKLRDRRPGVEIQRGKYNFMRKRRSHFEEVRRTPHTELSVERAMTLEPAVTLSVKCAT